MAKEANIDVAVATLDTELGILFNRGLSTVEPKWMKIAMLMTSSKGQKTYPMLGAIPKMREWLGDRQYNRLQGYSYTLANRKFEDTIVISREAVEDDELDMERHAAQELGSQAAMWPDDLVTAALLAGGSSLCYDGQYFFDTDHPVDPKDSSKGAQGNLSTSTALTAANLQIVRTKMAKLKREDGEYYKIRPTLLIVPPALEKTALEIVSGDYISITGGSTQSNVLKGAVEVLVLEGLSADTDTTWYLADMSKSLKPLMFQQRIAPALTARMNLQDPAVFDRDEFVWGTRARGAAGYALWQLMHKCTA